MQQPFAARFIQPTIKSVTLRFVSTEFTDVYNYTYIPTCTTILTYFAAGTTFYSLLTADKTCSRSACADSRHSVQRRLARACVLCGQCSVCVNSRHSLQRRLARACVLCGQCSVCVNSRHSLQKRLARACVLCGQCKSVCVNSRHSVQRRLACACVQCFVVRAVRAKTSGPCVRSFSVFSCSVCASLCTVGVGGQ